MITSMLDKSIPKLDELYKEIILEHYRKPQGRKPLDRVDFHAEGMNPLCGDEVNMHLKVNDKGIIEDIYAECHGCSISVSSTSMLADILKGKTVNEAKDVSKFLKDIMQSKAKGDEKDIGDLEALVGVRQFPVRIKCALLAWTTFEEALVGHEHIEIS